MPGKPVPPRIFVIFAKEAHEAVIFRRGPSMWCQVIRWDTQHDAFYPGAWIKGRIYPEKSDLSPNGELLLCFIHQGGRCGTAYTSAWTAISRSPWLHALGLWPQGTTYGGGGRFIDNRSAELRYFPRPAHPDHPGIGFNVSFSTVYSPLPYHKSTEEVEGAEWSGRDQRGRLVYASEGKLMHRKKKLAADDVCLADFNHCIPDPQPAPDYARRPLGKVSTRSKEPAVKRKTTKR